MPSSPVDGREMLARNRIEKDEVEVVKLTLQVSPELDAVIERLAHERSVPKSQILRRAVALMDYLDDGARNNKDILLRDAASGETEKLVLESTLHSRE